VNPQLPGILKNAYLSALAINNSSSSTSSSTSLSSSSGSTSLNSSYYNTTSITQSESDQALKETTNLVDGFFDTGAAFLKSLSSSIGTKSSLGAALSAILNVTAENFSSKYSTGEVGISNTTFGNLMSESWYGTEKSFLNYFSQNKNTYKINILNSTPLDSGTERNSIYGSLMLGCPFLFNSISDPGNRTMINSLIKDSRFLSLTPGLPKYNGGVYTQADSESIYKQTTNPNEMMSFLLKNGLDNNFSLKDKRYYVFQSKYDEYYSYLEAMLTPI